MKTTQGRAARFAALLLFAAGTLLADPAYVTILRGQSKSFLPWAG